jgi:5-carboxyvanillate decarboxylase
LQRKIIDVETHVQAREYVKEIESYQGYPRYGYDSKGRFTWYVTPTIYEVRKRLEEKLQDENTRLHDMDEDGIDLQIIASSNPGCEAFPIEMGRRLARINNDLIAKYVANHPDRFVGFASLPLQDLNSALEEFDRVKTLGLKGLIVFSNVGGKRVDLPQFWPIFQRAQELNFPIFLHPCVPTNPEMFEEYHLWGPAFGFGADTSLAALRIIMSGLLEEYPKLKILLGHLGEGIPFFLQRINWVYKRVPEDIPRVKRDPSDYFLNNFYVDTSGVFNEPSLRCVYDTIDRRRIVFGSDYPFEKMVEGVKFVSESTLPEEDKKNINWNNPAEFLGL